MKTMYYLKDIDADVLLNERIYRINHDNEMLREYQRNSQDNSPKEFNGIYDSHYNQVIRFAQAHPKIVKEEALEKPLPRKKEQYRIAYDFLVHILIERTIEACRWKSDETISEYKVTSFWLSSSVLFHVFNNKYKSMLDDLHALGIINIIGTVDGNIYELTTTDWECKTLPDNNKYSSFFERYESALQQHQEETKTKRLKEAEERLGNVYEPYMDALGKLKCDADSMKKYIESHKKEFNAIQYDYYMWIQKKYEMGNYVIQRVDENHRIYTVLTQTPSHFHSLLPFTNVKYEVDLSNCHPMLFNLIIKHYYHTPLPSIVGDIDGIFFNTVGTWKKSATKHYPKDVEEYMSLTSKGKFWDDLLCKYTGCSRKEIKPKMFADVFYAKNLRICPNQTYGKDFQMRFPTIMKIIRMVRRYNETILANFLMKVESRIIQNAMNKLYAEGFVVLNIHDAIVVLDVPENKTLTEKHVQDVLLKSVSKYGLSANAKIERIKG